MIKITNKLHPSFSFVSLFVWWECLDRMDKFDRYIYIYIYFNEFLFSAVYDIFALLICKYIFP